MKVLPFIGKFMLYLTIMFVLGIPAINAYLSSSSHALNAFDFFTFYLPMNLIPYFALVLATPIENNKKLKTILSGTLLIFLFNIVIIMLQRGLLIFEIELFYVYSIGRIAFPFLLWFAFTYNDLKVD